MDIVQGLARTLAGTRPGTACAYFAQALQGDVLCGGQLSQLFHYGPGFAGSLVTRRGPTRGGRFSRAVVVPVHYAGPRGAGDLDVKLARAGETYRIVQIAPPGTF